MIREARLKDKADIIRIAAPYLRKYPLRPDMEAIYELLNRAISSSQHFCWVAEEPGERVNGVILAMTDDNLWAQKKNCQILLWVSNIPGEGVKLLRVFRDFVKSRPVIKVAGACPDIEVDERVWLLAGRVGFKRQGGAYLMYA